MQLKTEIVTFRDKRKLTVSEENWDIGMRLSALEQEALKNPDPNNEAQIFKQVFYPKLAACSTGEIPTEEEARQMPSVELDKWYGAVKRVNPQWFKAIDALMDKNEEEKKKVRKRRK